MCNISLKYALTFRSNAITNRIVTKICVGDYVYSGANFHSDPIRDFFSTLSRLYAHRCLLGGPLCDFLLVISRCRRTWAVGGEHTTQEMGEERGRNCEHTTCSTAHEYVDDQRPLVFSRKRTCLDCVHFVMLQCYAGHNWISSNSGRFKTNVYLLIRFMSKR